MPKHNLFFFLSLLFFFPAEGSDSLLSQVRAKIRASQPFRVEFNQQVNLQGEKEIEESGFILYSDPQHIKWEYQKPEKKVFILDGDRFQFYVASDRQLIRGRIARHRQQLIWNALFAENSSATVTVDSSLRTLSIFNDSETDPIDITFFIGQNNLPMQAVQKDITGIETIFHFRHYRPRTPISAQDFLLIIPKDTEIVEESENS